MKRQGTRKARDRRWSFGTEETSSPFAGLRHLEVAR